MPKYTLFHGTNKRFSHFTPSTYGSQGPGIYFADRVETARGYGKLIVEAEVSLKNPFYFYPTLESFNSDINQDLLHVVLKPEKLVLVQERLKAFGIEAYGYEVQDQLVESGYDGIVMSCPWGQSVLAEAEGDAVVIAFRSEQIKVLRITGGS